MGDLDDVKYSIALSSQDLATSIRAYQQAMRSMGLTSSYFAKLSRQQTGIAKMLAAHRQLFAPDVANMGVVSSALKSLRVQQDSYSGIARIVARQQAAGTGLSQMLSTSSAMWAKVATSYVAAFADMKRLNQMPFTASQIVRPLESYSRFSTSVMRRLPELSAEDKAPYVQAIQFAEAELEANTAPVLDLVGTASDEPSRGGPVQVGALNIFVVERDELIAAAGSGGVLDIGDSRFFTHARRLAAMSRRFQQVYVECNQAASLSGRGRVFAYSDQVVAAVMLLPYVVARNKVRLGEIVDGLFFAVYEAGGFGSPRFQAPLGPLTTEECAFVKNLKLLRNKWYRHDPEHGSARDVRSSNADLRRALSYFGFTHRPTRAAEFQDLHLAIMGKAVAFLEALLDKLQGESASA